MNVGSLVAYCVHRESALSKTGVIIEKLSQKEVIDRFDTGEIFVVLWSNGQLSEHKRWDLLEVRDERS